MALSQRKVKQGNGGENYRVTLDFSKESQEYIENLQKISSANTKAELFKQALNVFDFVVSELLHGGKFILIRADNSEREILFPLPLVTLKKK